MFQISSSVIRPFESRHPAFEILDSAVGQCALSAKLGVIEQELIIVVTRVALFHHEVALAVFHHHWAYANSVGLPGSPPWHEAHWF